MCNKVCERCLNNELHIDDLQDLNDRQARLIDQILDAVDSMTDYLEVLGPEVIVEEEVENADCDEANDAADDEDDEEDDW